MSVIQATSAFRSSRHRAILSKGIVKDERNFRSIVSAGLSVGGDGKPIIRSMRIAVEHILGMLAAGSTVEELLNGYPFLEKDDIQACLIYAHRMVAHERIEPLMTTVKRQSAAKLRIDA